MERHAKKKRNRIESNVIIKTDWDRMTRRARSIGRFQIPNSAAWNSDVGAFKSPTRLHETPMPRTVNPGNTLPINTKLKPAPQTQTDRKTETKQTCYVKIVAHVSWRVILAGWETRTNEFARNDSGNVQFACTIDWNGINWLRVHGTQSRKAETGQSSPLTAGCYLRPTRKKIVYASRFVRVILAQGPC